VIVEKGSFTIGRAPDNDLQIPDQRLSGKHCQLLREIDASGKMIVYLVDTSSNGTFLNGQKVIKPVLVTVDWERQLGASEERR